jgi:methionyl-tRNA synthetase
MANRFYVTTPIYYVNAEPHIGHAYTTIVNDVFNRYHRLMGFDTFFLTGTDEHGEKIVHAAEAAGEDPKAYVDRISGLFREAWPKLNVRNDDFIRTTDPRHVRTVQHILQQVYDSGDIYFGSYKGNYCVGCERFLTDHELVDGKCPDHDKVPEAREESNYFFRMGRYQDWLVEHIHQNPDFIRPERYKNEVLSMLREPLEDLCISRPKQRLSWGIPLPFDDNFVTYVWFDALINYVSALGYPEGELFETFWPVAQHTIAKDILKPHAVYWPTMIRAAGLSIYRHLNVHGYWRVEEAKMSKSRGTVIKPLELVDKWGLDAFRYFLLRDMVFGLDANFSEEALIQRLNSDLANDLGNLFSRTTAMTGKYFQGLVPPFGSEVAEEDRELLQGVDRAVQRYTEEMPGLGFHKALMAVWELINQANKYIDSAAPWELAKDETRTERLKTVIRYLLELNKTVAVLVSPFMPETAEEMLSRLGRPKAAPDLRLEADGLSGFLPEGGKITKGKALFPRVDIEKWRREKEKAVEKPAGEEVKKPKLAEKPQKAAEPQKPPKPESPEAPGQITIQQFQGVELKVGTVRHAERVAKSDKLLKLVVDVGEERQVVAGIAQTHAPEDVTGKQVVLVANLKPAKLMGIESHGMVLGVKDGDDFALLTAEKPVTPGGRAS